MTENTNKTIAINSLILYIRLAIVSICGLIYTRFSLQALGINDYGLFSVIASVISFASIINTIMITTSNRFIAMAIGKGDYNEANISFNVNLVIHISIAILTIAVSLPLGHLYINHYITYTGDLNLAKHVFDISLIASAISFVGVPYNGLLMARERFIVFCSTDVLACIFKLICTYILIYHFEEKLIIYAIITSIMTAYPTIVFIIYCNKSFKTIIRLRLISDKRRYIECLKFSVAIGYGAIALLAKIQGGIIIINMFFNIAMNAGLAIANSVNSTLQIFAYNAQKSISPQIVKSYAANDINRSIYLVCLASRATYLTMLFVSIPFMLIPEQIFGIWLKTIPPYAITFTRLLIIDALIFSINAGINDFVNATGKIRTYQIVINTLVTLSVIIGFFSVKLGMKAEYLFYSYIAFSCIVFIVRPFILVHISHFDIKRLILESYFPVIKVTISLIPFYIFKTNFNAWGLITFTYLYFIIACYMFCLTPMERKYVKSRVSLILVKFSDTRKEEFKS